MVSLLAFSLLAPRLAYRWFYVQTNLFREDAEPRLEALLERAAKAGYNGMVLTDSKLQSLDPYPDFYRTRVSKLKAKAKSLGIDVIPVALPLGYADGMLAHDPSLVESGQVRDAVFVARDGVAQLAADPLVAFPNGDFESVTGDRFDGFAFQDGIGVTSFADHAVKHGGGTSLRIENPGALKETTGNCRIMREAKLRPWRHYRFSAWVKTEAFASASSVRLLALAQGKPLSFHEIGMRPTQDWTQVQITFDSKANEKAGLYLGVWGGTTGKLWFDDARLEEVGLTNLVRRPGCPLNVKSESGTIFEEGRDFESVKDPDAGVHPWPGEYDVWHPSPPIKLKAGGRIREGQRLLVSFSHALSTEQGKTALCLSEPAAQALESREIKRVAELFGPEKVFFAHDEIRVMNEDEACQKRGLSPARLLADDISRNARLSASLAPKGERFIWSDMIDPYHNAVADYYLVDGDLRGVWEGLPRDLIVVNWNSGRAAESLPFFDKLGHRQILAGYYDGDPKSITAWLKQAEGLKGVVGAMYTTWVDRYDDLEAFAKAAWGGRADR